MKRVSLFGSLCRAFHVLKLLEWMRQCGVWPEHALLVCFVSKGRQPQPVCPGYTSSRVLSCAWHPLTKPMQIWMWPNNTHQYRQKCFTRASTHVKSTRSGKICWERWEKDMPNSVPEPSWFSENQRGKSSKQYLSSANTKSSRHTQRRLKHLGYKHV